MSSGSFLNVVARNFDVFAGPLMTLVYPLYASVKAIETRSTTDDQQWLTYWVLHSLVTLFELLFAKALEWVPLWPYVKLCFTSWLVLPYFNGAAYVYQQYVRPLFMNQPMFYSPRKKDNGFSNPGDILAAAERYIDEHGPEEFEKLISKAERLSKYRSSKNCFASFDDLEAKSWSCDNYVNFNEDYRFYSPRNL